MLPQFFQVVICDLSQPQMPRFVAFHCCIHFPTYASEKWFVHTGKTGAAPHRKPTTAQGNRIKMGRRVGLVATLLQNRLSTKKMTSLKHSCLPYSVSYKIPIIFVVELRQL